MVEYIKLLNTELMPYGHCYFWEPALIWSHAISDSLIALAYFIIPFSLIQVARKRADYSYQWVLVLFTLFFIGSGLTHVMDVVNIWEPLFRIDSVIRILTAAASLGTAALLIYFTPKLILFPGKKKWKELTKELQELNEQLERKVDERTRSYREMAAEFHLLTDAIPQMVWRANEKGEIDFLNKNWYTYTQQVAGERSFSSWVSAIHPEDRKQAVKLWEEGIRENKKMEMELRLLEGRSQTYRWHLLRNVPLKDKSGQAQKWFGTATDIHENKILQQQLESSKEELDKFVYVATQELKTPANNLDGLMQVLESRMSEETRKEAAPVRATMAKSIEQLKMTVNDLADISRLQRYTLEEGKQQVNLHELIEDFKHNHQVLMKEAGARIEKDLQVSQMDISRHHIRSILGNLLSNSLKYRAQGRLLRIKVQSYETDSHYVLLVQDNGLGIQPEYHEKMFEMFRRFHKAADGTGVGLYIVKRLVDKYQGHILVESKPEKGSNFRIYLPK